MKNNIANSNRIFVDRSLSNRHACGDVPSLWMLCTGGPDFTDTALRVFLMLCLITSLVLGGLKVQGTSVVRGEASFQMSMGKHSVEASLPVLCFSPSIR